MTTVSHPPRKGYRTIRLPLGELEYDRFTQDRTYAKSRLEELYEDHPALFPEAFGWGYALYGFPEPSIKQHLRCRRLRLEQGGAVCTVAPAFVMPSMSGRTDDVDKAVFLMRCHVPCWAIVEVFGRDPRYGYRFEQGLGRFSVVGTTVKQADRLSTDLVADEKHRWLKGERVYIATTTGQECMLGASVAKSAGQADVQTAYGVFAEEAWAVDPDYAPATVHTDGWQPTQGAWKTLFEHVTRIRCLLHAFLKIRDRTTKALGEVGQAVHKRVWEAYHAPSKRAFAQR